MHCLTLFRDIQKKIADPIAAKAAFQECAMTTIREILKAGTEEIVIVHGVPQSEHDVPQYLEKTLKFNWDLDAMHTDRRKHEEVLYSETFDELCYIGKHLHNKLFNRSLIPYCHD